MNPRRHEVLPCPDCDGWLEVVDGEPAAHYLKRPVGCALFGRFPNPPGLPAPEHRIEVDPFEWPAAISYEGRMLSRQMLEGKGRSGSLAPAGWTGRDARMHLVNRAPCAGFREHGFRPGARRVGRARASPLVMVLAMLWSYAALAALPILVDVVEALVRLWP